MDKNDLQILPSLFSKRKNLSISYSSNIFLNDCAINEVLIEFDIKLD